MRALFTRAEITRTKRGLVKQQGDRENFVFPVLLFKHCLFESRRSLSAARNISSPLRRKIIKTFTRKKVTEHKLLKNSSHSSLRGTLFCEPSSSNINKH